MISTPHDALVTPADSDAAACGLASVTTWERAAELESLTAPRRLCLVRHRDDVVPAGDDAIARATPLPEALGFVPRLRSASMPNAAH